MIFTDDTAAALGFMAAVADTVPGASESGEDELATTAGLKDLLDVWGFSGRRDGDRRELDEVRAVRDRLRAIWTLERDDMVDAVNGILEETNATPDGSGSLTVAPVSATFPTFETAREYV